MAIDIEKERLFFQRMDEVTRLKLLLEEEEEKFMAWVEKEDISDEYFQRYLSFTEET